ncbi:MAG: glycosyltransferase family 4 protein [bacterium]|nr:glycosyltransferase family 4 protein [bacterium]
MHTKQFSFSKKQRKKIPYILSLRRLVYSKGVDLLIKAFANLEECYSRMQLWIAGSGPEKKKLMALAKELRIERRVRFLGDVSLQRAVTLLRQAELTVVPSRSEGGGLVNIEAQAVGCPLVASKAGGIPEYTKDKKTALLHIINDAHDLRIKVEKLLQDDELRNSLIKNGIKFAQKFDWRNMCPKYISLYNKVSSKKNYYSFRALSPLSRALWRFLQK